MINLNVIADYFLLFVLTVYVCKSPFCVGKRSRLVFMVTAADTVVKVSLASFHGCHLWLSYNHRLFTVHSVFVHKVMSTAKIINKAEDIFALQIL